MAYFLYTKLPLEKKLEEESLEVQTKGNKKVVDTLVEGAKSLAGKAKKAHRCGDRVYLEDKI